MSSRKALWTLEEPAFPTAYEKDHTRPYIPIPVPLEAVHIYSYTVPYYWYVIV